MVKKEVRSNQTRGGRENKGKLRLRLSSSLVTPHKARPCGHQQSSSTSASTIEEGPSWYSTRVVGAQGRRMKRLNEDDPGVCTDDPFFLQHLRAHKETGQRKLIFESDNCRSFQLLYNPFFFCPSLSLSHVPACKNKGNPNIEYPNARYTASGSHAGLGRERVGKRERARARRVSSPLLSREHPVLHRISSQSVLSLECINSTEMERRKFWSGPSRYEGCQGGRSRSRPAQPSSFPNPRFFFFFKKKKKGDSCGSKITLELI